MTFCSDRQERAPGSNPGALAFPEAPDHWQRLRMGLHQALARLAIGCAPGRCSRSADDRLHRGRVRRAGRFLGRLVRRQPAARSRWAPSSWIVAQIFGPRAQARRRAAEACRPRDCRKRCTSLRQARATHLRIQSAPPEPPGSPERSCTGHRQRDYRRQAASFPERPSAASSRGPPVRLARPARAARVRLTSTISI